MKIKSSFRISYCSADATYDHVFNFIATNSNNTMECHAFLCKKRKIVSCRGPPPLLTSSSWMVEGFWNKLYPTKYILRGH